MKAILQLESLAEYEEDETKENENMRGRRDDPPEKEAASRFSGPRSSCTFLFMPSILRSSISLLLCGADNELQNEMRRPATVSFV